MKKSLAILALFTATVFVACGEKKAETSGENTEAAAAKVELTKEKLAGKGRACWNVTTGTAPFGNKVCFNDNGTANVGEGGFGPFTMSGDQLTLKDNNAAAITNPDGLTYTVTAIDDKSMTMKGEGGELVLTKQ